MLFSEKLKTLRKQFKFSQEQLAGKIGVSRQAITKWETDGGLPDIENIMAIAALFSISLDDLLSDEKSLHTISDYTYESSTEYDISRPSHFDINAPAAFEVCMTAVKNEKLRVRLASNVLQTIEKDYKVQIDEHRNRMDINIRKSENANDTTGKESLHIFISLPSSFSSAVELSTATRTLHLVDIDFPFELDGKAGKVVLQGVSSHIALNSNADMDIGADRLPCALEINQINATSVLHIPGCSKFYTKIKGRSNRVILSKDGKTSECHGDADAESLIELAGMNTELVIDHVV